MSSSPPPPPRMPPASAAAHPKLMPLRDRARIRSTACRITRAVQTISSFHRTSTSISKTARKYFYSPQHFPRIFGALMFTSGVAGYVCSGWWHERQLEERNRIYIDAYHRQNNGTNKALLMASPSAPSSLSATTRVPNSITSDATITPISSWSTGGTGGRNAEDDEGQRVLLVRKMTRRIVSTTSSTTIATNTNHALLLKTAESPFQLQRQVTKFW